MCIEILLDCIQGTFVRESYLTGRPSAKPCSSPADPPSARGP